MKTPPALTGLNISLNSLRAYFIHPSEPQWGTLQLNIRRGGGGCLYSLGSVILFGKYILEFFKKIDLDDS